MLKRGHPFTPEPAAIQKKNREYHSPLAKTPLRNVTQQQKSSPGTPLNDDARERRQHRNQLADQRRQMKKIIMSPATVTPKANPVKTLTPLRATPVTPSAINPKVAGQPGVQMPKLTPEQRNKMFEEWMKIASENKINAKNSWNVALIDYFSELTFIRDGDSINFQKASCTLDGCVKIYSTRVDAIADETERLMNGFESVMGLKADNEGANSSEDASKKLVVSKRRPRQAVDTLAPNFDQFTLKNFDLEFSMDPLFKKTCAEFDDGTSKGLLTSRLGMNKHGRLIFDSIDAERLNEQKDDCIAEDVSIDITNLLGAFGRELASLDERVISPTLADHTFQSSDTTRTDRSLADTLTKLANMSMSLDQMEVEGHSDSDHEDHPADAGIDFAETGDISAPMGDAGYYDEPPLAPAPPSAQTSSYQKQTINTFAPDATETFLAYFDSRLQKNWAGPEHWKIRRPHLRRTTTLSNSQEGDRPARQRREFVLDFDGPMIDPSAIFQRANPVTITLSKSMMDEQNLKDNLLPEDMHFSSASLLRPFLKPNWTFTNRTISVPLATAELAEDRPDLVAEQVDPSFWAELAQAPSVEAVEAVSLNDDYVDDGGYYGDDTPITSGEKLNHSTQSSAIGDDLVTVARPMTAMAITYARRAKVVDIQLLKRTLWAEIESITTRPKAKLKNSSKQTTFTELISELPSSNLPREMLQDISVPYCFICLLHLANEHNLDISSTSNGNDLIVSRS